MVDTGCGVNTSRCWRLAALKAEGGCKTADFAYPLGVWAAMRSAPPHVPHAAVKREFANEQGSVERLGQQLAGGDQRIDRNRQMVSGALFADGSRREVDGDALRGEEASVLDRRLHRSMYASGRKRHKSPEGEYRCPKAYWGYPEPGCPRSIGWHKLDKMLWEKVLDFVNRYRQEYRAGLTGLETKPSTPEGAKKQFEIKRHAVEALVIRVDVQPDRTIKVTFLLDAQVQNPQADS